jgi:hypothetical protein
MPWFKMDDRLYSHPKWLACSMSARGLWATSGSWCAGNSHDGEVPARALQLLGGNRKQAAELVEAGLWEPNGDGWIFHDWPHYQPTSEQVEAERAAARERQRRARDKAASRRESRRDDPVTNGSVTVPPTRPDPTPLHNRPSSSPRTPSADPETGAVAVDFEHHPPERIPDDMRERNLAVVASLKHAPKEPA